MFKTTAMRKLLIVALLLLFAGAAGCGGGDEPSTWLEDCRKAVEDYDAQGGYLRFKQESVYVLGSDEAGFQQRIDVEGDIILPDRETYEYREELSSSLQPEITTQNSFSYITLDGGSTAYVSGERLETELGVTGWVRYTPPEGQNRYFDYTALIDKLTTTGENEEWLGYEEVEGARCAYLRYRVKGQVLLELRMQEDPGFAEQFQGLDVGEMLEELVVEIWIREADRLPQQLMMRQSTSGEEDVTADNNMFFLFTAYGEEAPAGIEAPASFTEAD
jgi:hypothetical protein